MGLAANHRLPFHYWLSNGRVRKKKKKIQYLCLCSPKCSLCMSPILNVVVIKDDAWKWNHIKSHSPSLHLLTFEVNGTRRYICYTFRYFSQKAQNICTRISQMIAFIVSLLHHVSKGHIEAESHPASLMNIQHSSKLMRMTTFKQQSYLHVCTVCMYVCMDGCKCVHVTGVCEFIYECIQYGNIWKIIWLCMHIDMNIVSLWVHVGVNKSVFVCVCVCVCLCVVLRWRGL